MQQPRHSNNAVFAIIAAVLWIPFIIAMIWIVNLVVYPPILVFTVLGISLPVLASAICQWQYRKIVFGEQESQRNFASKFHFYGIVITPFLLFLSAVSFLLACILNFSRPLFYAGMSMGYIAVAWIVLCSVIMMFRVMALKHMTETNTIQHAHSSLAWAALLFSVDAILLTAFFTFVIRQLLLM